MALMIEYLGATTPVAANGIFISDGALPGFNSSEIDLASPARDSKFVLSFLNQLYTYISGASRKPLGFNMTKPNPVGAGANLVNQNFSLNHTYALNHQVNGISSVPAAGSGTNANNFLAFDTVFPGSVNVEVGDTPGRGVSIPEAELAYYGGLPIGGYSNSINLTGDSRTLLIGITRMLAQRIDLKSANNANSAIVQANKNTPTIFTPPIDFAAATNPLSGISAGDLPLYSFINVGYSFTIQLKLDDINQTFDVNVENLGEIGG